MFRNLVLTALIAGCCTFPAGAQSTALTRSISLTDLNLSSATDRATLDRRLQRAAYAVCGAKSSGDAVGNDKIDTCRAEALTRARRDAEVRIAQGASTIRLAARIH